MGDSQNPLKSIIYMLRSRMAFDRCVLSSNVCIRYFILLTLVSHVENVLSLVLLTRKSHLKPSKTVIGSLDGTCKWQDE